MSTNSSGFKKCDNTWKFGVALSARFGEEVDLKEFGRIEVISYSRERGICYTAIYCPEKCCVVNSELPLGPIEEITGPLPEQERGNNGGGDFWYLKEEDIVRIELGKVLNGEDL